MMSTQDKKILELFTARVRDLYRDARVWAYGSRVRGDATWESDFDIFILLPKKDEFAETKIRNIGWEIGFEHERVLTTVIMEQNQFEHGPMSESTLVKNILHEGLEA